MDTFHMVQPRYKAFVDDIAARIRSGELTPGTRLPTHRAFAAQENISLVTATRVYQELISRGLVSGETGRGTFVRDISLLPTGSIEQEVQPELYDLNFIYPEITEQADLLRRSLRQLSMGGSLEGLLHYLPHAGRRHERTIVAQHLTQRGFRHPDPERILMVSGAQHGLAVIVLGMFSPGDVIATDALTYPGFKALAQIYHIELVAVPVTPAGPDLNALDMLCRQRKVRGYFTMPTLHNPLGWVMSNADRKALIRLARVHQFRLIEDGSYAFLQHPAPPPLAALAPDITFYVNGFSKNMATGLRVGVVVAPAEHIAALERIIRITTWNTPALTTAIVSDWLERGDVNRLERSKRRDAGIRQALVRRVFEEESGGGALPYIAHPHSYFFWLPLPEGVRCDDVISHLRDAGVAVSPAESYAVSRDVPQAVRVAVSTLPLTALETALRTVKTVVIYLRDK